MIIIISYKIHLKFCNIWTDFHYPSPKNLKKWRPVDITGLRWVLNQMVGPILQCNLPYPLWRFYRQMSLMQRRSGNTLEPEAKAHKTLGNRPWVWITQTPPIFITQLLKLCWFHNGNTKCIFYSINGVIWTCQVRSLFLYNLESVHLCQVRHFLPVLDNKGASTIFVPKNPSPHLDCIMKTFKWFQII